MEQKRILREKELMKDDFGNCEECEEADIFLIMKAKYICHDCQINMCEQCEMAHKRVGVTKYHFTEALVKLNIPVSSLRKNVSEFEVEDLNNSVANMSVDNIENPFKPWWTNFNTSEESNSESDSWVQSNIFNSDVKDMTESISSSAVPLPEMQSTPNDLRSTSLRSGTSLK